MPLQHDTPREMNYQISIIVDVILTPSLNTQMTMKDKKTRVKSNGEYIQVDKVLMFGFKKFFLGYLLH